MKLLKTSLSVLIGTTIMLSGCSNNPVNSNVESSVENQETLTSSDLERGFTAYKTMVVSKTPQNGGYKIYEYSQHSNQWYDRLGAAVNIAIGSDTCTWVVTNTESIYRGTGEHWYQVRGKQAKDIGVGTDATVWIISNEATNGGYHIYRRKNRSIIWEKSLGGGIRIDVGPNGLPWIVDNKNEIYRHSGGSAGWIKIPGKATDIGIGGDGSVWIIGNTPENGGYGIYRYKQSNNSWEKIPGGAKRISVDRNGKARVVTSNGVVYKYNGSGWTPMVGVLATDIGVY